ncbi:hypothetical protein BpsS36_00028 [Bacillus phage vB_BpsS-36]|uniref:Holin n=1 Tax=Bacillus phage vB_BpsS-36 TaxID=2419622 RepID=A0A3G3BX06_9CAUD|nr:hypothetical protein BpsS36_00028 [Bacillus phage vB_BpsS-36]
MKNILDKFNASKWSSRKFLVTVFALVLVTLNDVLGLSINPETYWQIIGAVSVYVLGESVVDAKKKGEDKEEDK